jgi:metal-dependent amidase/aminoacylase/carboxypeptidase family protein
VAEGAATMTGARLEWIHPSPANADMVTNYSLARAMKKHLDALGLTMPEAVAEGATGSTDWGNVSYVVPSVETSYPILDRVCTWHSMDVVDASMSELGFRNTILVAKAMALAGLDVMRDRSLRENIGTEYASQVPAEVRDLVQSLV